MGIERLVLDKGFMNSTLTYSNVILIKSGIVHACFLTDTALKSNDPFSEPRTAFHAAAAGWLARYHSGDILRM
jgi:hypothetical protein